MRSPLVRFLAHRARRAGRSDDLLGENTIAAVRTALELRPAYIEVDTRNLSDGTIVLRHNPSAVLIRGQPATTLADITREHFAAENQTLFNEVSLDALFEIIEQAPTETTFVLDVKDLDGQHPEANLRAYFDRIVARGLERRVVIISWNILVVWGLIELNRTRPSDRRIRVGVSFVPLPLPAFTFRALAWLVNRVVHSSFGGVSFYNVAAAHKAALSRNSLFPICVDRIENVRRSLGDDTILCFHKFFAQGWLRRIAGPFIGLAKDLREPPPAVWLYDYDDVAEIRSLSPHSVAGVASEELVLFSRSLGQFDFKMEERRLSQATPTGWVSAEVR